uniref:Nuclear receptor domain-containing protein n=2 Tax=Caenorhabditis japonica TaxID=281687 RepID=A0A8R1E1C8_CAEJA
MSTTPHQTCLICGDTADSLHFGALSCRACAAFFRRKVAGRRDIFCRCDRQCKLDFVMRKLCASCRFDKCLKAGMHETAVLSRLAKKNQNYKKPRVKDDGLEPSTSNPNSVLVRLQKAYLQLENARKRAYGIKVSTASWAILPNGDYIDQNNIEEYYRNPDDINDESGKAAAEVFKPYWRLHQQSLRAQLNDVQLDLPEFLFITALIFWDFGLDEQTADCIDVCKRMRSRIIEELTDYEKNVRVNDDHSYRVGQIIIVLQAIQRALNLMHETREISLVYNLYEHHSSIFEAMESG